MDRTVYRGIVIDQIDVNGSTVFSVHFGATDHTSFYDTEADAWEAIDQYLDGSEAT